MHYILKMTKFARTWSPSALRHRLLVSTLPQVLQWKHVPPRIAKELAIFQEEIIIFQGQFSIPSSFSIESSKKPGIYLCNSHRHLRCMQARSVPQQVSRSTMIYLDCWVVFRSTMIYLDCWVVEATGHRIRTKSPISILAPVDRICSESLGNHRTLGNHIVKSTFFNRKSGFLNRKSGFFHRKLTWRRSCSHASARRGSLTSSAPTCRAPRLGLQSTSTVAAPSPAPGRQQCPRPIDSRNACIVAAAYRSTECSPWRYCFKKVIYIILTSFNFYFSKYVSI